MLSKPARDHYKVWVADHVRRINNLADRDERDTEAGILGKIKEYALRFGAILTLSDAAMSETLPYEFDLFEISKVFKREMMISGDTMRRALRLAEYFYISARDVSSYVKRVVTAPPEVLQAAVMMKMGKSYAEIGDLLYGKRTEGTKQKAYRKISTWLVDYPLVFGSKAK
jgi:hypothetical protein